MTYKIRKLKENDLDSNSFFETLSNLRPVKDVSRGAAKKIFKDCRKKGIETLVAEENGKIIGTVRLLYEPKFYHQGNLAAHIEDVVTHKKHNGKGVARALINRALIICRQKKCYKIILDCEDSLIKFYSKFDFKPSANCLRLNLKNK